MEDVIEQLRAIIQRLHEAGVAHLDLHENNVCVAFLEESLRPQLIDFGLAEFVTNPLFAEYKRYDTNAVESIAKECRRLLSRHVSSEEPSKGEESGIRRRRSASDAQEPIPRKRWRRSW